MREERIEKQLIRVMKVIDKMKANKSPEDTKRIVKVSPRLYLEIICVRDDLVDIGAPLQFEAYAIKDGKDIDGITLDNCYGLGDFETDIKYLLNCYM